MQINNPPDTTFLNNTMSLADFWFRLQRTAGLQFMYVPGPIINGNIVDESLAAHNDLVTNGATFAATPTLAPLVRTLGTTASRLEAPSADHNMFRTTKFFCGYTRLMFASHGGTDKTIFGKAGFDQTNRSYAALINPAGKFAWNVYGDAPISDVTKTVVVDQVLPTNTDEGFMWAVRHFATTSGNVQTIDAWVWLDSQSTPITAFNNTDIPETTYESSVPFTVGALRSGSSNAVSAPLNAYHGTLLGACGLINNDQLTKIMRGMRNYHVGL